MITAKTKNKRNKSDLGDNFIAPDGGWGWLICIFGGVLNLSILPVWQLFGLLFMNRLSEIGLTSSNITTIVNSQPAVASCVGLFSGQIYRRFTYRQVSFVATIFVTTGILLASISNSFLTLLLSIAVIFGFGMSLSTTSTNIAINTYFNKKRRTARSFTLTVSGCGTIFMPHLANILMFYYGFQGTLIIFAAIAMHAFPCSLIYQPVQRHLKKIHINDIDSNTAANTIANTTSRTNNTNFIKVTPKTSTVISKNNSNLTNRVNMDLKQLSSMKFVNPTLNEPTILHEDHIECPSTRPSLFQIRTNNSTNPLLTTTTDDDNSNISNNISATNTSNNNNKNLTPILRIPSNKQKWYQTLAAYFDLDLLNDFTFVNILIGLALTTFSEVNFSILTPFFLTDFGFSPPQIADTISVQAVTELAIRFLIPFVTENCNWDNRIYFLIGISGMTIGRILIAQIPKFHILLIIFGVMGLCRALRTVFMGLVIPDHVQLDRLPAATGLQLLATGVFNISCGPAVGFIRDATNPSFMLYFLSSMSTTTIILWTVEIIYESYQKTQPEVEVFHQNLS